MICLVLFVRDVENKVAQYTARNSTMLPRSLKEEWKSIPVAVMTPQDVVVGTNVVLDNSAFASSAFQTGGTTATATTSWNGGEEKQELQPQPQQQAQPQLQQQPQQEQLQQQQEDRMNKKSRDICADRTKSRLVAVQGMFYVAAFMTTYICWAVAFILERTIGLHNDTLYFFAYTIFLPMQGKQIFIL